MKITLKLFATLGEYLPAGAFENAIEIEVPADATAHWVIDRYKVPRELTHLVLINGVFHRPADRDRPLLEEGDALAIWPPVAGG